MSINNSLQERANGACELCTSQEELLRYEIPPNNSPTVDNCILICSTCKNQLEETTAADPNHWRCLNEAMWSEVDGVKVVSWRMLNRLKSEGWTQDLLDMLYLEDETLKWAAATGEADDKSEAIVHRDANGVVLENGDNVVLTKDLNVKGGASFVAKRGTAVRRISLVWDNAEHIEGRVENQQIVILTKFVKKT